MLQNMKALIFDLDGTVVDSMGIWREIDIAYLKRHGHELPEDLQDSIEGMSFYDTAKYFQKRFQITDSLEQIMDDWNQMAFQKYSEEVPLKEHIPTLLQYCKKHQIKLGLATSNSRKLATEVLQQRGILQYFDGIMTGCGKLASKPAPDIYLACARELCVSPDECLVFEDLPAGIIAGNRAGMKTCAVFDEYSKHLDEEKHNLANYYINSYSEIDEIMINEDVL